MRKQSVESIVEGMMQRPIPKKKIGIVHLEMVKEGSSLYGMERFSKPQAAADAVRPLTERANREMFLVMSLDAKLAPMALEIVSVGSTNACFADPRDVFRHSIINNATNIICFHNHPSGDPEPSWGDKVVIQKLGKAGMILGIELIDHIILGDEGRFFSFREEGILTETMKGAAA